MISVHFLKKYIYGVISDIFLQTKASICMNKIIPGVSSLSKLDKNDKMKVINKRNIFKKVVSFIESSR